MSGKSLFGRGAKDQVSRAADGGRIDRARPLTFTFDGKSYQGYEGDTLASALLANNIHLVGRSFKYHRPRGIIAVKRARPRRPRRQGRAEPACHPGRAL